MSLLIHSHFNSSHIAAAASNAHYKPFLDPINVTHMQGRAASQWNRLACIRLAIYFGQRGRVYLEQKMVVGSGGLPSKSSASYLINRCSFNTQSPTSNINVFQATSIIHCWALYDQRLLIPELVVTVGRALFHVTINIKSYPSVPQFFKDVSSRLRITFGLRILPECCNGLDLTPLMKQLLKHGVSYFVESCPRSFQSCVDEFEILLLSPYTLYDEVLWAKGVVQPEVQDIRTALDKNKLMLQVCGCRTNARRNRFVGIEAGSSDDGGCDPSGSECEPDWSPRKDDSPTLKTVRQVRIPVWRILLRT
ncbi:hypothetical protein B0J17DRAFT_630954 [Rhizoctonia solani]|nr:hypothetical protein B0J17DRAFT_630954 [Rhizoctonia solani]